MALTNNQAWRNIVMFSLIAGLLRIVESLFCCFDSEKSGFTRDSAPAIREKRKSADWSQLAHRRSPTISL
ncbi:hypothetical protein GCM10008018_49280 [Paenibacillus marchantiophytorum]|uniref:Secreted protein n=1 Tax=Paenibacillus marchantiophytorum TaxID=1619310 RepID=A0ABQ1F316_9BACL|nr:hypothetical protein [Paenibacillus marchantiophytorum]GFZ97042.1 hypothetical protein GCM10008018_49280 [Paenibacillus marchantiophytorum]